MRSRIFHVGCMGALLALAPVMAATAAPAGGSELNCLANAIYQEAKGADPVDQEIVAWVVKNRRDSPEFPGSYCELAEGQTKPPWSDTDVVALLKTVMDYDVDTPQYKGAVETLNIYRGDLEAFRLAQVVAHKLLKGWSIEDPTSGQTEFPSEQSEAESES